MKVKSNCYTCQFRAGAFGSAHSRCVFRWHDQKEFEAPKGDLYGIASGWWYFPLNYDPVWMITECEAHVEKDKEEEDD